MGVNPNRKIRSGVGGECASFTEQQRYDKRMLRKNLWKVNGRSTFTSGHCGNPTYGSDTALEKATGNHSSRPTLPKKTTMAVATGRMRLDGTIYLSIYTYNTLLAEQQPVGR